MTSHTFVFLVLSAAIFCCQGQKTIEDGPPKAYGIIIEDPEPIENVEGRSDLHLQCNISANTDNVVWSFNGVRLKSSDGHSVPVKKAGKKSDINNKILIKGNTLSIYNVKGKTKDDPHFYNSGRYRCMAINKLGAALTEKKIQIRVLGRFLPGSRQNDASRKHNPIEGRHFEIKCPPHSTGYGTEYRWGTIWKSLDYPEFWLPGERNERIFYQSDGTLIWSQIIRRDIMESRDIGGLRCILVNKEHYAISNQHVLWQPYAIVQEQRVPTTVRKLPSKMIAPINSEYTMTCGATGSPEITYHWQYEGKEIKDGNVEFLGNKMQLRIKKVSWSSGGTYTCFAKNDEISRRHMKPRWSKGTLTVQSPPKWTNTLPEIIKVVKGKTAEMVCKVSGFPKPVIKWYLNGKKISKKNKRRRSATSQQLKDETEGKLVIQKAEMKDGGVYTCLARNSLDRIAMSTYLQVQASP